MPLQSFWPAHAAFVCVLHPLVPLQAFLPLQQFLSPGGGAIAGEDAAPAGVAGVAGAEGEVGATGSPPAAAAAPPQPLRAASIPETAVVARTFPSFMGRG